MFLLNLGFADKATVRQPAFKLIEQDAADVDGFGGHLHLNVADGFQHALGALQAKKLGPLHIDHKDVDGRCIDTGLSQQRVEPAELEVDDLSRSLSSAYSMAFSQSIRKIEFDTPSLSYTFSCASAPSSSPTRAFMAMCSVCGAHEIRAHSVNRHPIVTLYRRPILTPPELSWPGAA